MSKKVNDVYSNRTDLFNSYCFTAKERKTLEQNAAADPEILGKLFEYLLDVKYRKQMGAFYTPPEIVQYMCRESLANYLVNKVSVPFDDIVAFLQHGDGMKNDDCCIESRRTGAETKQCLTGNVPHQLPDTVFHNLKQIDNALEKVSVFDPAVGAGAFTLGMLNEIVKVRLNIIEYLAKMLPAENLQNRFIFKRDKHQFKLKYDTTKNCLFAVDIESRAVEVTKLRLWLSLAADYLADGEAEDVMDEGMPCLPALQELDCNIKCCDSLLYEPVWAEHNDDLAKALKAQGGFDIIIGNPPYISAVESSRNDKTMRVSLKKKYPLLKGAFDIYAAFLLEGVYKTNKAGIYCWIVPNKLLVSGYAVPVLEFLKQNGLQYSVSVSHIEVFTKVGVYPIIVMGNKMDSKTDNKSDNKSNNKSNNKMDSNTKSDNKSSSNRHTEYVEYIADTMDDLASRSLRLKTTLKAYKTFADYNIKFASGATGFQAKLLSSYITEQKTKESIPFIVSGSVDKYSVNFSGVRYMGSTYSKAYISKGDDIAESKWRLWCGKKIVIAGLTKEIEAAYCEEAVALGVGAYAIYDFAGFNPKFLLGLLNSKFLSWYLNIKFSEKHLAGGYLAINKSTLEQLPLVQADTKMQLQIAQITDEIQNIYSNGCTSGSDCAKIERLMYEIDTRVFELFGVSDAEIII